MNKTAIFTATLVSISGFVFEMIKGNFEMMAVFWVLIVLCLLKTNEKDENN